MDLQIPVNEIFDSLRKTPAGKYFLSSLRYKVFKTDKDNDFIWKKVLGPSGVTFYHMEDLYELTSFFLKIDSNKTNKIKPREQRKLLTAVVCHDFGEAILQGNGIGDIPDPLKTKAHENIEKKIFYQVIKTLDLNEKLKKEMTTAYEEVVMDESSQLHSYFRSVENFDYILTALRVVKFAKRRIYLTNGKILVGNVLARSVPYMINGPIHNFYSFRFLLDKKASQISSAFNYSLDYFRRAPLDGAMKTLEIDSSWKAWTQLTSESYFLT